MFVVVFEVHATLVASLRDDANSKTKFTAYQGMSEGSQAEGSLGLSVRAINQSKLAGEYLKKKKK